MFEAVTELPQVLGIDMRLIQMTYENERKSWKESTVVLQTEVKIQS